MERGGSGALPRTRVFVRTGTPDVYFGSWKTWERGAPQLTVEIVSDSDAPDRLWDDKLARYAELGVVELVRFDPAPPTGSVYASGIA